MCDYHDIQVGRTTELAVECSVLDLPCPSNIQVYYIRCGELYIWNDGAANSRHDVYCTFSVDRVSESGTRAQVVWSLTIYKHFVYCKRLGTEDAGLERCILIGLFIFMMTLPAGSCILSISNQKGFFNLYCIGVHTSDRSIGLCILVVVRARSIAIGVELIEASQVHWLLQ